MNPRHLPRFVIAPVALAAAAVVGFGPSAGAVEAACGQPGTPAVYDTVQHPAVVTAVPAVTHLEWRWERTVPTTEVEYSRVTAAAQGTWTWSRSVDVLEREYVRTVVDRAAAPAVDEQSHVETRVVVPAVVSVLWEYVQQQTGNTRWEVEGWNAGNGGKGWSPTGATQEVEVTPAQTEQVTVVDVPGVPAVTELSHVEHTWVQGGDAAPVGSTATGATRVAGSVLDDVELPDGETPAGDGWVRGEWTQTAAAQTEEIWLLEGDLAPDGYDATGHTRAGTPAVGQTTETSATAPAGDGWAPVAGSETTVEDAAAYDREDEPAWTELVLVTPEVPATDDCPTEPTDGDGDPEDTDEPGDTDEPAVEEPAEEDLLDGDVVVDQEEGEVLGVVESRTPAADALPATGAGAEPWMLGLGAASVLAGLGLVRGRGKHAAR
ncbi:MULTISPECIES: LPXTG cell wall anchor domain-containing protein [unclassified Nocardioides]|uniref:LPXTG cell wall anchor domain-containing protein n=1 Tax=unclassified Nocardioides TaxID=2615069 RepID=UPI0007035C88|nr:MULTISPECIES: LPXTG cell wall anchor domain-containing protein [unclassified Nocardioides]KRC53163.1 hypothetical protein ASE19_12350 [Nocardioides sp. Root79]KRC72691.1 hypothetical protein ASE20_08875 [Nocardioides sp. Root240]